MLHDISHLNLVLENFGATIETIWQLLNFLIYSDYNLTYEFILTYTDLLANWFTQKQMDSIKLEVLFTYYTNNSYWNMISEVYNYYPSLFAFDYLHLFFFKQLALKSYLAGYQNSLLTVVKPIVISLHINFFFSFIFNKWGYASILFFSAYFLSNLMKVRYQYGFNFYFNYFKLLSDLGEQEYGSYDDFKFFLFILIQMLVWYLWILFIGYTFTLQSESKLILLTLTIMISILLIPIRILWDFGLTFSMYIRGAASSSSLIIEAFFDMISVIIIFTRFIVQNIRFLMVFVAYFELFEWTFGSSELNYMINFNLYVLNDLSSSIQISPKAVFVYILCLAKVMLIYFYHLLHLIIVSFMQIGVYLMVSFWLFFFLYTSFFKITGDSYFFAKRN